MESKAKASVQEQTESVFLVDRDSLEPVPLKSVNLNVDILGSLASFQMAQNYDNPSENPLETLYLFPVDSEDMVFSKIQCRFVLSDGQVKEFETLIDERKKLEYKYEDSIATGKTAVIG